jgi:hypothetical protein
MGTRLRRPDTRDMRRAHLVIAWAVLVVCAPLATWWVVGDVDEPGGQDHMFEPVHVPAGLELTVGIGASTLAVGSLLVLASPRGRRLARRTDAVVAGPLVAAGVFLGFGYRVVTAAVGGANIGGGLVMLFGMVALPAALVTSLCGVWGARRARTTDRTGHRR